MVGLGWGAVKVGWRGDFYSNGMVLDGECDEGHTNHCDKMT
jgi:hypothetical protein